MARKQKQVEAVAYIRTSSAANVGADKDSEPRQRAAIEGFAKRAGFALVAEYTDAADFATKFRSARAMLGNAELPQPRRLLRTIAPRTIEHDDAD